MTPMSELAECRCGAAARLSPPWSGRIRAVCVNDECDIRGPRALSEVEAIAAWNALMRPRPTATKGSRRVYLGSPSIRIGFVWDDGVAQCTIDGWHLHCYSEDDAMAELVEHLRGLGFDVKEVSGD